MKTLLSAILITVALSGCAGNADNFKLSYDERIAAADKHYIETKDAKCPFVDGATTATAYMRCLGAAADEAVSLHDVPLQTGVSLAAQYAAIGSQYDAGQITLEQAALWMEQTLKREIGGGYQAGLAKAERKDAQAAQAWAEASQSFNQQMQHNEMMNSLNRPRTTSCYGYGYSASCTTY